MVGRALDLHEFELPTVVRDYCPHLTDKMLVDFANGLDVAAQKIHYQGTRTGFLKRSWDVITGQAAERERQIAAHLQQGLEASLAWLAELEKHQVRSDLAIAALGQFIARVANHVADTKARVTEVERILGEHDVRISRAEQRLSKLELAGKAERQMQYICGRARNGDFRRLPPMTQVLLVCDRLYWGDFGCYVRTYPNVAEGLCCVAVQEVRKIAAEVLQVSACHDRVPVRAALACPGEADQDLDDAVAFLTDWADQETAPFAWSAARYRGEIVLPQGLPRLMSANIAATRLFEEVFDRDVPTLSSAALVECGV